jgi:ESCRT-II complex subunit VPS36
MRSSRGHFRARRGTSRRFVHRLRQASQAPWVYVSRHVFLFAPILPVADVNDAPDGLLSMMESTAVSNESNLSSAFTDLKALMAKAGEMLTLAVDLNERLSSAQATQAASPYAQTQSVAGIANEEADFVRSSLVQLGMALPGGAVTKDMAADEQKWHAELARELASVLQGQGQGQGVMASKPIVPLDEVWGAWNRARGVALLPPATLLAVIPLLEKNGVTSPKLKERKLKSGLRVLCTEAYEAERFAERIVEKLAVSMTPSGIRRDEDEDLAAPGHGGGKTTAEIAREEGLSVALAREMIEEAEQAGHLMREDPATRMGSGGVRIGGGAQIVWWGNLLKGYTWDGQE